MNEIIIKCLLHKSIETYKFNIYICDENNNIIFNGCTNKYGIIKLYLLEGIYSIYIYSKYTNSICTNIIVNSCLCNKYKFYFDYKSNLKTIILTDKNYKGLKIEKGEIYLWQSNM